MNAEVSNNLASTMSGASIQVLVWFSLDVVDAMNVNIGYMQLLTPGIALRIIDSYVVSATSNGTVNWTQANANISSTVDQMIAAGLMKLPPGMSSAQLKSFAESLAKAIYTYKESTKRAHL